MSAPAGTRRGSLAAMDTDSCCSSDGFGYSDEEDLSESSEDGDYGFDPHAEVETSARQVCRCLGSMLRTLRLAGGLLTASDTPQAPYVVFSEEQLRERQDEAVSAVTGVLSISKSEAVRVLRQCKWCARCAPGVRLLLGRRTRLPHCACCLPLCKRMAAHAPRLLCSCVCLRWSYLVVHEQARCARRDVNRVNEEWFTDTDAMRRKVGILEEQPVASTSGKVRGRASAVPPQLAVEPRNGAVWRAPRVRGALSQCPAPGLACGLRATTQRAARRGRRKRARYALTSSRRATCARRAASTCSARSAGAATLPTP